MELVLVSLYRSVKSCGRTAMCCFLCCVQSSWHAVSVCRWVCLCPHCCTSSIPSFMRPWVCQYSSFLQGLLIIESIQLFWYSILRSVAVVHYHSIIYTLPGIGGLRGANRTTGQRFKKIANVRLGEQRAGDHMHLFESIGLRISRTLRWSRCVFFCVWWWC